VTTNTETPAAPTPIKRFALCPGNDMQVCASCSRNVDNHDRVSSDQPMLTPTLAERGRCGDWRA